MTRPLMLSLLRAPCPTAGTPALFAGLRAPRAPCGWGGLAPPLPWSGLTPCPKSSCSLHLGAHAG
jgi:hypothetical protein